jgi:hypothetical protein
LNRAAYRLGRLVESGAVRRSQVETSLENAAVSAGLSFAESRATIASGINASTRTRSYDRSTVQRAVDVSGVSREL